MKRTTITVLGGGSAQARLLLILLALRAQLALDGIELVINSIVTVADDGGSAGRIRRLFGGPSLGDIVNLMAAVARNQALASIISSRFGDDAAAEPGLKGHKLGNLILDRGRKELPGGLSEAIETLSRALDCQAAIIPSSLDSPELCIELSTGEVICGEHHLDTPQHDGNLEIAKVWLAPDAALNPDASAAILAADHILISAGDPHGSIAACLKVKDMPATLERACAPIGTIVPLFNRYGQSTNWVAADHINFAQTLIAPARLSAAFVNTAQASPALIELYAGERESQVDVNGLDISGVHIYRGEYLDETPLEPQEGDAIRRSSLSARHGKGLLPDLRDFIER